MIVGVAIWRLVGHAAGLRSEVLLDSQSRGAELWDSFRSVRSRMIEWGIESAGACPMTAPWPHSEVTGGRQGIVDAGTISLAGPRRSATRVPSAFATRREIISLVEGVGWCSTAPEAG